MPATPGHRRRIAWIALIAFWALALVPTVSRALAFASGDGAWAEVCTAQGARLVALEGRDSPLPQASPALDHCEFCSLGLDNVAPPPATAATLPLPLATDGPPRLFLQAPCPLFAWRSAQPRAPPAAV